jgi:hypothetical protein
MHDTTPYIEAIAQPYTERTYTAQEIAEANSVNDATVRLRWFKWLCKVAPEPLLKSKAGYSELANTLFTEFAQVDKRERMAWVADAKARYAAEWGSVGVIDCEVMPEAVGGTLALLQTNLELMNHSLSQDLARVDDFISQLNAADANYSEAEVASWAANGAQKAVAQFRTEEVARAQTLNALRQQRLQGGK